MYHIHIYRNIGLIGEREIGVLRNVNFMGINQSKLNSYRNNNGDSEWKWSSLSPLECNFE